MLVLETCCCGLMSLNNATRIISGCGILFASGYICANLYEGISTAGTPLLVWCIISMPFSFLAFYDTFKERPLPSLLIPFLAVLIFLLLILPSYWVGLIWEEPSLLRKLPVLVVVMGATLVWWEALFTYCFLVVYGYYKEVQRGTEPQSSPRPT